VDLRFAYGLTFLLCVVVGWLILLVFRKATGRQAPIHPAKAFWVGIGLLLACCLASSIIESCRSSDAPDAVNAERVRRAAGGAMGDSDGPRVHEPSNADPR
jgi:hypothetical protein